jgi:hypothetical protein
MDVPGRRPRRRSLGFIALVALGGGSLAASPATSADAAPRTAEASPAVAAVGRAPLRGTAAIARLDDRIDDVAARHHMSEHKLEHLLRTDPTLGVDANEQLFYTEPLPTSGEHQHEHVEEPEEDPAPPVAQSEGDDAFALHSRPGAPRTIYLDFDGHTVTGSAWTGSYTGGASCYADSFTTDGDGSTFSAGERAIIESVWKRVSEDYAPFAVDVTTEEPPAARLVRADYSDLEFGTRALITSATTVCSNSKTLYQSVCPSGCGGVAYVGVFNFPEPWHSAYQPALVFSNALSNSAKNVAEATSHEVGHNLGLSHDGATTGCGSGGLSACSYYYGQSMWAPVMGVGYNKPVVQWSKGDYSIATNTQDDLAVMQSYGLDLMTDDHGDDRENATDVSAEAIDEAGLIASEDEVDVFGVNVGDGSATFAVTPAATSPNLDARLELRDEDFALVTSNDPASAYSTSDVATGMSASISTTLSAGRYYLVVDGVGTGTSSTGYSDYASLGRYTLTGSAAEPDPEALDEPAAPTAVAVGPRNAAVEVDWDPPDDEGSAPVSDYRVSVYAYDGGIASGVTGATERTVGSSATSFSFTGLTNDTGYLFKVAAINAIGTGDETDGAFAIPDGDAPETTLTKPTGTWTLSASVPVAWTATDGAYGSGLASTQVVRRAGGFNLTLGAVSTWKAAATATPTTYSGSHGTTYCFKARAKDVAGNVDAYTAERCTAIPLKSGHMVYSKGWTAKSSASVYSGTLRTTKTKNASVTRTSIKAKQIALVAAKCGTCGTVKVYWNGTYKKTVNLAASTTKRKQVVPLLSFGSVTSGTLKLVVASSGRIVSIEGLGVSKI